MLCTVMLPTRKRPQELVRCISSILATADGLDFEILVRIDNDDATNSDVLWVFDKEPRVKFLFGPRLGYDNLDTGYYTQLAAAGQGKWSWIMNDDMEIVKQGEKGWDTLLAEVPEGNFYVQPEIHGLGASRYPRDTRTGSPCFLKDCWFTAGFPHIPPKADYTLTSKLEKLGWKPWFIEGIMVWHDRGTNAQYEAHHKL